MTEVTLITTAKYLEAYRFRAQSKDMKRSTPGYITIFIRVNYNIPGTEEIEMSINPINLRCGIYNDPDGKTFTVSPCKEDKVYVVKFAIGALLANQGYQALSLNFELYMNDPENKDPMKTSDEVSKYLKKNF
ncbi:10767_t:CDS:2 [Ambispora gerdemannii]|uniref:10767_t:CDS:1 n=1 Tax=Ambispora gerdemannii TaxID=144530 RepID=A0A9N8VZ12_9GLOM|nr:10767_t:CDS:2 [Ambispora gerdemannii]